MPYLIFHRTNKVVVQCVRVASRVLICLISNGFWAMYLLESTIPSLIWEIIEWDLLRQN